VQRTRAWSGGGVVPQRVDRKPRRIDRFELLLQQSASVFVVLHRRDGGGEVPSAREQYMQALASLSELTRAQAERLGGRLARQGELQSAQVSRFAEDLVRRTQKNREAISRLVQREVKRQLGMMGIATRDEVARLQQRVRALEQELERAEGKPASGRARSTAAGRSATTRARGAAAGKEKASPAGARTTRTSARSSRSGTRSSASGTRAAGGRSRRSSSAGEADGGSGGS
jgi:polyhydroxyalkanoate synthesis regulator phasin